MSDEEIQMWEIERDAVDAERMYDELLRDRRNCYQLKQVGVVCPMCEHKEFKVDLSLPF